MNLQVRVLLVRERHVGGVLHLLLIVILQIFLAMERDGFGLDLALLDVDLVAAEDDGNILADANQITYMSCLDQQQHPLAIALPCAYGASWERSYT